MLQEFPVKRQLYREELLKASFIAPP